MLIQCGNQFTADLIRECQNLPERAGNTADGSMELAVNRVMRVEKKLGVLRRFWLADQTAFVLWAAFSRAWGSGTCGQCVALCAGDAPSSLQSTIAEGVPNLNPGLGLHKLHSSTAHGDHQQVFIPGQNRKKLQVYLAPVIRQHIFYRTLILHCFNLQDIHMFSTYKCYGH